MNVQHQLVTNPNQSGALTLTSAVSLWQFLHARPIPEKALSGWSNLLSLALRKNMVKGSCGDGDKHIISGHPALGQLLLLPGYSLSWASTSAWSGPWSTRWCSGAEACCHRPMSRSALHKTQLALDSEHRLAGRYQHVSQSSQESLFFWFWNKMFSHLWKISEISGQSQIQLLWVVVGQNPGEDRVLVQVVVGPPCRRHEHQFVEDLRLGPDSQIFKTFWSASKTKYSFHQHVFYRFF